MGKKKAIPIQLSVNKQSIPSLEKWRLKNPQVFFPPVETLFKTDHLERVTEYGIKFSEGINSVVDEHTIRTSNGKVVPVHRKTTMLLSPFRWMKGEFGNIGLPTSKTRAEDIQSKLQNPNNAGYVGSILSVALSESGCIHFPKVYGVYVAMSGEHTIDISDDYIELCERTWFTQNIGKTFEIKLSEKTCDHIAYTRTARPFLNLEDECQLSDVEELENIQVEHSTIGNLENVFNSETDDEEESDSDGSSSVSTSYIFKIETTSYTSQEVDEDEEFEEDDEPFAWATFKDVPVQVTVMEKCEGTLYELMSKNKETEKHVAWLAQVVFALAFAQRTFSFTHNDLHANNVMYVPYEKEFLYYCVEGVNYKIPTYGYLIKIIDFDRGIGSIRLAGMKEPKLFMSDQFAEEEEAGGQYNTAPFYNTKYPVIKPNPSFDLVRLATSLFWDFFPNGPKFDDYESNPVFKVFMKWLTLPDGSSILFHKQNPKQDRYLGFHLYKAIARYCKDTAVPRNEVSLLKEFVINSIPSGSLPLVITA